MRFVHGSFDMREAAFGCLGRLCSGRGGLERHKVRNRVWRGKRFGFQSAVTDRRPQRRSDNGQLGWLGNAGVISLGTGWTVGELSSNGDMGRPLEGGRGVIGCVGRQLVQYLWVSG